MKRGDVIVFKGAAPILDGKKGLIVRVSKQTGGLTVQLLEDAGAYKRGAEVNVAKCDVRSSMETR